MVLNSKRILVFAWLLFVLAGCQRAPMVSGSAEPNSVNSVAPMASDTSNAELLKRKKLVDQLFDGEVSEDDFKKARGLDLNDPNLQADESSIRLAKMIGYLGLEKRPDKISKGSTQREFWEAQFYFYERRFIEAAQIFSRILDVKPGWLRARNLLARCFYFLGNTDRAFLELQFVVANHSGDAEELLDALFLIGAIAMDSQSATSAQVEKGVGAWQTYLKLAPNSPLREKIQDGLAAYEAKKSAKPDKAKETGNAKSDAIAALDGDDLLHAENKIRSAMKKFPRDEELAVALGRVYVKSGRVKEALEEFQQIVAKNPRTIAGHHYQGMAFMLSGAPEKAIASWEKVVQLDANYAERFNLSGRILIAKNLMKKENR